MKEQMLTSLKRRYADIEDNDVLVLATLLDPCFQDKFFSGSAEKLSARELLKEKVTEITSHEESAEEPSPKHPMSDVLKCFSDILEEAGVDVHCNTHSSTVDKYLSEPLITFHRGNSFTWWANNKTRFPSLAKLAQRYLSAPPTSVPSERLFSGAGDIYDEKRNRLAPENAETLLFIKNNFQVL